MTTKPKTHIDILRHNSHHFIASFEGGYNAVGDISTYSHETCHVCKAPNVPCLTMDSSEGEYGPGCICAKCLHQIVLPLLEDTPSPSLPPSETYEEREAQKRYDNLYKLIDGRRVLAAEVKASDVTTHRLRMIDAIRDLDEFIETISEKPLWEYDSGTIWLEGGVTLTIDDSDQSFNSSPFWLETNPEIPAHLKS